MEALISQSRGLKSRKAVRVLGKSVYRPQRAGDKSILHADSGNAIGLTHVAWHMPHSKRESVQTTGMHIGRNCHVCSTPLGSGPTFSHAAAVSAGGAAPTPDSPTPTDSAGDTISIEPTVVGALPVFTQ